MPNNEKTKRSKELRDRRDAYLDLLLSKVRDMIERGVDKPCIAAAILKDDETKLTGVEVSSICLSLVSGGCRQDPLRPQRRQIRPRAVVENRGPTRQSGSNWPGSPELRHRITCLFGPAHSLAAALRGVSPHPGVVPDRGEPAQHGLRGLQPVQDGAGRHTARVQGQARATGCCCYRGVSCVGGKEDERALQGVG